MHRDLARACRALLLMLTLASLLGATHAQAEAPRGSATALRYDLRIDVPVTVTAIGAWIVADLFKAELTPSRCRLCAPNDLDQAVRDGLYWRRHRAVARTTSDLVGLVSLPLAALSSTLFVSSDSRLQSPAWIDGLILSEAVALSIDVNHVVKLAVARRRPFVQARTAQARADLRGHDDNLSFYSGHTNLAFSAVVAAGTLATLHRARHARWIWAIGLPLATLTGYLRIAADKHYLTDVVTGAVVGAAMGGLVPFLHRARPELPTLSLGPTPASLALTFRL